MRAIDRILRYFKWIMMLKKTNGYTFIELLLSLAISAMLLGVLITAMLMHCKIHRIQSAFIHLQNTSRVVRAIIRSDIRSRGYAEINRYRINHSIFYRADDHGRFQPIADNVSQMNVSYDREDGKNISGVSIALDWADGSIKQREYLYVAL